MPPSETSRSSARQRETSRTGDGEGSEIPWRLIVDMRNLLAHGYFSVSLRIVWDTATTQIMPLEDAVRRLIQ